MELVVIEKNAYLRLKQQVEDLSTQIEAVKKKFVRQPLFVIGLVYCLYK